MQTNTNNQNKNNQTSEDIGDLDSFFTSKKLTVTCSEASDEHLIFSMLQYKDLLEHSFFHGYDTAAILKMNFDPLTEDLSVLTMEAFRRYKARNGTKALLASRIAKASSAVLCASSLAIKESAKEAVIIPIQRGTLVVDPAKSLENRAMHSFSGLVQIYKPVKDRNGNFVPAVTDASGEIYPRPVDPVPDFVRKAYAKSKTADQIPQELASLVTRNPGKAGIQMQSVPAYIMSKARGGESILRMTKIWRLPNDQDRLAFAHYKINTVNIAPDYASFPKYVTGANTVGSAYAYLNQSRKIRGEDSRGLSFNTASYYYGDLPSSYVKPVSIGHNMVFLYKGISQVYTLDGLVITDDKDCRSGGEIAALNIPVTTVNVASRRITETTSADAGWSQMEAKKTYLVPIYVSRTCAALKRTGFQWTPSYEELHSHVDLLKIQYENIAKQYDVTFVYAVHTKMCPVMMERGFWTRSLHPHSGSVWWFPYGQDVVTGQEEAFSSRMALANAWKNYYPFHRIPFCKFDCDKEFSLIIKRGGVTTPAMMKVTFEFDTEPNGGDGGEGDVYRESDFEMLYKKNHEQMQALAEQVASVNDHFINNLNDLKIDYGEEEEEEQVEEKELRSPPEGAPPPQYGADVDANF